MFRRMYGRPRHLLYNRNMSVMNQIPFLNNYLPFGNGGGMQGMFQPQQGWMDQSAVFSNLMNPAQVNQGSQGFPFQNMTNQNYPFNMGTMNPINMGAMNQNGFPLGSQQAGMQGGGMFPQAGMLNAGFPPPQMNMPFMNPYPTQNQSGKPQPSQVSSFMNQFKGQDGNVDMKKMMDTAGQMVNTVNQLNNMVKGIAATFKA